MPGFPILHYLPEFLRLISMESVMLSNHLILCFPLLLLLSVFPNIGFPACMAGDLGWSLGQEDPLEKEMATHSSTLAWKIPWMEESGGLQRVHGATKSRTRLGDFTFFPINWFFALGSQSIGASASASVLPMTVQVWFPLVLTGLISQLSKGLSRVFSNTAVQKHQFFGIQFNSHIHAWLMEKP